MDNLVQTVGVERRLKMGQAIVHLTRALRVAQVEDLVQAGGILDRCDVRYVVVESHAAPSPSPVLWVLRSVKRLVAPTVHRATIVSNPDIVTSVDQLQVERLLIAVVVDPGGSILQVTMLDKYSASGARVGASVLPRLAKDVESGQDVVIVRRHGHWLPIVAVLGHQVGEPRILRGVKILHRGFS